MNTDLALNMRNLQPMGVNPNTGMSIYQAYEAPSGFTYQRGIREIEGLLIVEDIAEGAACMYLSGVRGIERESGKVLFDIDVEHGMHYTRKRVMEIVRDQLCHILAESLRHDGQNIDSLSIEQHVAKLLDKCYFQESRQAALDWAKRVGIIQ
jgi:hypothetical protein